MSKESDPRSRHLPFLNETIFAPFSELIDASPVQMDSRGGRKKQRPVSIDVHGRPFVLPDVLSSGATLVKPSQSVFAPSSSLQQVTKVDLQLGESSDFSSVQLVQQLEKTKAQIDKLIPCLLPSIGSLRPLGHVPITTTRAFPSHSPSGIGDFQTESSLDLDKRDSSLDLAAISIKPRSSKLRRSVVSHSWPPSYKSPLSLPQHDMDPVLLKRVQEIALKILETPVITFLDTEMAPEIVKDLQGLLSFQRVAKEGHGDASDLLTKLLFLFAPLLRIIESLVRAFIQRVMFFIKERLQVTAPTRKTERHRIECCFASRFNSAIASGQVLAALFRKQ